MIKTSYEISNKDTYKKYNMFEIHEDLKDIIAEDYLQYGSENFDKEMYVKAMYKQNFYDKYDKEQYKEVYEKYIDDPKFQSKAMFIYSIIDFDKYVKFVEENENIENPNELTISYSIVDSEGVKVNQYNIGIRDISFVF